MKRLRSTGVLIVPLLGTVLLTAACGGESSGSGPVQASPGAGHGGGQMGVSQQPTQVTPAHPMTGSAGAGMRGNEVAPSGGASPNPPPMPDDSPVATPGLTPVDLLPGARSRIATWRLAGREGTRVLLLDVQVGGPPCDAVTAVDVDETANSVRITVHSGVVASSGCGSGAAARLGVVRVRAHLQRPLGSRRLLGG